MFFCKLAETYNTEKSLPMVSIDVIFRDNSETWGEFSHSFIAMMRNVLYILLLLHENCNLMFMLLNALNILVKIVSFYLEWLHPYSVLKMWFFGRPSSTLQMYKLHVNNIMFNLHYFGRSKASEVTLF